MDERRLIGAASLLPTLAGMILLDITLLPPILGHGGGAHLPSVMVAVVLLLAGAIALILQAGTALRRWSLAGLLAPSVILLVLGLVVHDQVGEFSDLGTVITWMLALAAHLVFVAAALWLLATPGGRAILVLVLGLAGLSLVVGFASLRWSAIPSETGPLFLVGLPVVAVTLATAGSMAMVLATGQQDPKVG